MNVIEPDIDYESQALQIAALAHPARLKIISHLSHQNSCCVKDLVPCVDLAQSTVSQHLKILLNAGLVTFQTRQQSSWYEINQVAFTQLSENLNEVFKQCCGDCKNY